MTSDRHIDLFTRVTWRYLRGGGAPIQPQGTFSPVTEPMVAPEPEYFTKPLGSWINQAACAEADPRMFDLDPHETEASNAEAAHEAARAYCRGCPVATQCSAEGWDLAGLWGGELHLRTKSRRLVRQAAVPIQRDHRSRTGRAESAAIREWAVQNGWQVGLRGRLPTDVVAAYDARESA